MTGYLTHDANLARLQDIRTEAGHRRSARRSTPDGAAAPAEPGISIRRAAGADRVVIERLAALDSVPAPSGEILIAEVGGEAQAAIQVATGLTIADPFRRTAHLVELLRPRASALRAASAPSRRLRRRVRPAYRTA